MYRGVAGRRGDPSPYADFNRNGLGYWVSCERRALVTTGTLRNLDSKGKLDTEPPHLLAFLVADYVVWSPHFNVPLSRKRV
jgi:hypothetical protein